MSNESWLVFGILVSQAWLWLVDDSLRKLEKRTLELEKKLEEALRDK